MFLILLGLHLGAYPQGCLVAEDGKIGLGHRVASGDILLYFGSSSKPGKHRRHFMTLGSYLVLVYAHLSLVTRH